MFSTSHNYLQSFLLLCQNVLNCTTFGIAMQQPLSFFVKCKNVFLPFFCKVQTCFFTYAFISYFMNVLLIVCPCSFSYLFFIVYFHLPFQSKTMVPFPLNPCTFAQRLIAVLLFLSTENGNRDERKSRPPARAQTTQCSPSPSPVPTLHIGCSPSEHYIGCTERPDAVPLGRTSRSAWLVAEAPQLADG